MILDGIDLIPGSEASRDSGIMKPWTSPVDVQCRLASVLGELGARYDVCLIDCQPTFDSPSWAALVAADALVVPLQPDLFFGGRHLARLHPEIPLSLLICEADEPDLRIKSDILRHKSSDFAHR